MSWEEPERFSAVAYVDEEVSGRIDEAPIGNILEFVGAHTTGASFQPEQLADRVEITVSNHE